MTARGSTHLPVFHRNAPVKEPVIVATTANVTISTALNNGDTIDGVTLATGDRVLVWQQSTGSQNGIYEVAATPVRAYDMDDAGEVRGSIVYCVAGSTYSGRIFCNTNTGAVTLDSTSLTFEAFSRGGGGTSGTGAACKAYNAGTQNVNGTTAALTFNTEEFDTDGFHSTSSNTSRMTIPTGLGGIYTLSGGSFASAASNWMGFRINGSTIIRGYNSIYAGGAAYRTGSVMASLAAGDYVELIVDTTGGGSVNFGHASSASEESWFALARVV